MQKLLTVEDDAYGVKSVTSPTMQDRRVIVDGQRAMSASHSYSLQAYSNYILLLFSSNSSISKFPTNLSRTAIFLQSLPKSQIFVTHA